MLARWCKFTLNFKKPAGTSRGILNTKPSWFIILEDPLACLPDRRVGKRGIGECGLLPGLSADDREGYEDILETLIGTINNGTSKPDLLHWPSIRFGLEMAEKDFASPENHVLLQSDFTNGHSGIDINGLVWMGKPDEMRRQIDQKIAAGFRCIKLKIGAIAFEAELALLRHIRSHYPPETMEIRVDANGAFSPGDAPRKLGQLAAFEIHSIEQPIRAGQWDAMAQLCRNTPLPIALDEELIGIYETGRQEQMLDTIQPQAIILKPSLLGGMAACGQWIALAEKRGIIWWITSALESNIGLNAIAQYTFTKENPLPQGLGTGGLYTNNFDSPLEIDRGKLFYRQDKSWNTSALQ